MELDPNIIFQKLRGMSHLHAAGFALPAIIRDESGQINWGNVITGALTASVIAAGTTIVSLNSKVNELTILANQRAPYIDQMPAALERLNATAKTVDSLVSGSAAATSDRFRAPDAARMEARIQDRINQEVMKLEVKIDRELIRNRR